jgi:hypothetical protein
MSARHRVSKLLLAHGRVYDGTTTWNKTHRAWLGAQRFEQAPTELAFIDLLAAVDGLIARKTRSTSASRGSRATAAVADGQQVAVLSRRRHADRARRAPRARRRYSANPVGPAS